LLTAKNLEINQNQNLNNNLNGNNSTIFPAKNDGSPLVNTEVCFHLDKNDVEIPKSGTPIKSFVKKFIRKHTATYCMTTDGVEQNKDTTLRKFGTRLATCNSKINDFLDPKTIDVVEQEHENGVSRHIVGLIKCGSPWICPSCSATLSKIKGEELTYVVNCGRENGRTYGMLVITIRHKLGDGLEYLQEALTAIWRKARSRRVMREFLKKHKVRFIHRGYEIMGSIKGGGVRRTTSPTDINTKVVSWSTAPQADWHPHFNLVFDFDELPIDINDEYAKINYELEIAKFVYDIVNDIAMKDYGIELKAPYIEEIGFGDNSRLQTKGGVSFNMDFSTIEKYTTKFGLVEEATAGQYKNGNGSLHPFQILDIIKEEHENPNTETTEQDKILLVRMFREYALATKGKTMFRFAPDSLRYYKDNYGLDLKEKPDLDEAEETESKEQSAVIYACDLKLWRKFSPNSLNIANLLSQETGAEMEAYIFKVIKEREWHSIHPRL